MSITLYAIAGAPRPWRALLGLTFKGLDYDIHFLEASKGEQKSEPYISLNPRGKTPTLQDGDFAIRDSIAILAWLDRAYPEPPIFGRTPDEAAKVWQETMECREYLRNAMDGLLRPILFGGLREKTPELEEGAALMHKELARLEHEVLGNGTFLVGDLPSAADALAFPEVRHVQRAVGNFPELLTALGFGDISTTYPKVAAWVDAIEALPGYDKTFPPHWREELANAAK